LTERPGPVKRALPALAPNTFRPRSPEHPMKADIHPEYRFVVFKDVSNGFQFLTKSTIQTRETIQVDGTEYPLVNIDVSSESHPFYTGQQKLMDVAGRVDRYYRKYGFARPEGDKTE
jgi:large subunit ribosomal protein L31